MTTCSSCSRADVWAWHADAACREHPEVSFFPGQHESTAPAKACAACLVRAECLAAGLCTVIGRHRVA